MKKVFITMFAVALAGSMMAEKSFHFGVEAGYDHSWLEEASLAIVEVGGSRTEVATDTAMNFMDGFHIGPTFQVDFLSGKHIPSITLGLYYQFMTAQHWQMSNEDFSTLKSTFAEAIESIGGTNASFGYNNMYSHAIQIPLRVRYTMNITDDWSWFVYTGPQFTITCALYAESHATYKMDGKLNGEEETYSQMTLIEKTTTWTNGEKSEVEAGGIEDDVKGTWADNRWRGFDISWGLGIGAAYKNISINVTADLGLMSHYYKNYEVTDYYTYGRGMNAHEIKAAVAYRF